MTASLIPSPPGAARTAWSNPAPVVRATLLSASRRRSSLTGAMTAGRAMRSDTPPPGAFIERADAALWSFWDDAACVAILAALASMAGAVALTSPFLAWASVASLALAALSNWRADVALSSACERRWRAAREPS